MQPTERACSITTDTELNCHRTIYSVSFTEDGKQVISSGKAGILQRWQVNDGRKVGNPIRPGGSETEIYAAALSPNSKWLVCGLRHGGFISAVARARVGVWDAQTHKKVFNIRGHKSAVFSVDISPDSTKFATGGAGVPPVVFIWSLTTGKRLVGPLQHNGWVMMVRFSPTGDRIATAAVENLGAKSIRIYDSKNGALLLDIPCRVCGIVAKPLAWSADGCRLFSASYSKVKCFDTSSGLMLSEWSVPGGGGVASITLSRNQKFAVVSAFRSLSFWNASTFQQIGTTIEHSTGVWSIPLSPNDDVIAIAENGGKVTLRNLHNILPGWCFAANVSISLAVSLNLTGDALPSFFPRVDLPLMYISDTAYESWMRGDFTRVARLLTEEIMLRKDSFHHAHLLASRSLVRAHSKKWNMAIEDAKESIKIQRSAIGHIAHSIARLGNGDHESAIRIFDLVFSDGIPTENNFLLLIKSIILFLCGKHDEAILRMDDLINIVDDQSLYITIQAHMLQLLGSMSLGRGRSKRVMELLAREPEADPFRKSPHLEAISLIFGWNFDHLDGATRLRPQVHDQQSEGRNGNVPTQSKGPKEANIQYSPSSPSGSPNATDVQALDKRSKALATLGHLEDALKDADEAIKLDPQSPLGYKRRHAALHGLQRYDESMDAFARMFSLIEESSDPHTRQLGKKYVSPTQSQMIIDDFVREIFKVSPLVLIDVKSGRLCDRTERIRTFKSELQFKELVSSMSKVLDNERIHQVVEEYFRYITLSHVWQGKEPSFQDVHLVGSIWELDSSPLNEKLRSFCELVRMDGYRWAWSDTCCIDKTISTVLNQSLTMMYKWYEASSATYVHLADVDSPSMPGKLLKSLWMTRAWTAQELLAARVARFYDRDWKPYLGNSRANHKESPEILQELADAIGVSREAIINFNPDGLSVREKLRLASTRNAMVEEDVAYSLIGIFKSDIRPHYGEGDAALGHLLEEIVARSGEVTVLDWTGSPSAYNSCLPAALVVYSQAPHVLPVIEDATMDIRVVGLRTSLPEEEATLFRTHISRLPPARFANRRLYLPSIIFTVKKLSVDFGNDHEYCYRARISGIGDVGFRTSDRLSLTERRKLIFVHPWINDLRDPLDGFTWRSTADDESDYPVEVDSVFSAPLHAATPMDDYTRALRLVARLQQPFHALLLQQQPNGEFKRVATERAIVIPGIDRSINLSRDVRTEIVEIL